ncbi:hypothetical protein DERF_006958, partial [Dermatophagoides farinae]
MLLVHCCPYCSSTLTSPRIDQIAQTLADFLPTSSSTSTSTSSFRLNKQRQMQYIGYCIRLSPILKQNYSYINEVEMNKSNCICDVFIKIETSQVLPD